MRQYGVEEKIVKVCEGQLGRDKGGVEWRDVKVVRSGTVA